MGIFGFGKKSGLPTPEQALQGREEIMRVPAHHYVNKNPLKAPFPAGLETAMFGLGCFGVQNANSGNYQEFTPLR